MTDPEKENLLFVVTLNFLMMFKRLRNLKIKERDALEKKGLIKLLNMAKKAEGVKFF